ncbi:MAG: CPBP family intramembrane metalloprotease [Thaumarchaeota archaeon]|jgi:membrane protease YdiL (CAAX protease family)|nr:CPBP family intramembrane metalloprotease [Candidatus Geocrenenecus arthurdayi]
MLRNNVLVLSILPVLLNYLITPTIVILAVSLPEFLKNPTYYIYMYGFILWPLYHIILAGITLGFFKMEKESIRSILGPLRDKPWLTILLTVALLGFSILIFQIIEPHVIDLVYGPGAWRQTLSGFRSLPPAITIYGLAITPLTAGVCEELVWRGYLQTRFKRLLHGKVWAAIALQAILFGLWHGISILTLFSIVIGLACGYAYAKTGRLIPIMISHWLGDTIGLTTIYFI